jgi:antirestriction protein ArdC
MATSKEIRKEIADIVIKQMENAGTDWNKSWGGTMPTSKSSNKPYNGINYLLLSIYQNTFNYNSHEWATYNQWEKIGAKVKRGEKAKTVIFYKLIEKQTVNVENISIDVKKFPILKSFKVFNADQVDNYVSPTKIGHKWQADTLADKLASDCKAIVNYSDADRCYYTPSTDQITMTDIKHFNCKESYACTLLHELTHWTRNKSDSTKRDFGKSSFGNESYATEELVAELGSAMLAGQLGISTSPRKDHAKYLNSWVKAISNDNSIIFKACSYADKASKYLLDLQVKNTLKQAA